MLAKHSLIGIILALSQSDLKQFLLTTSFQIRTISISQTLELGDLLFKQCPDKTAVFAGN